MGCVVHVYTCVQRAGAGSKANAGQRMPEDLKNTRVNILSTSVVLGQVITHNYQFLKEISFSSVNRYRLLDIFNLMPGFISCKDENSVSVHLLGNKHPFFRMTQKKWLLGFDKETFQFYFHFFYREDSRNRVSFSGGKQ